MQHRYLLLGILLVAGVCISGTGRAQALTYPRSFRWDRDATYAINLGDLDGDGDLDIVAGNEGDDKVYFNTDGKGNFGQPLVLRHENEYHHDITYSVALGDINNDGHIDVICGNVVGFYFCRSFEKPLLTYLLTYGALTYHLHNTSFGHIVDNRVSTFSSLVSCSRPSPYGTCCTAFYMRNFKFLS